VLDFEFFKEVHIFFMKCLLVMVHFLIQDVIVNILDLRMSVGKGPTTFLPTEFALYPGMVVDEVGGVVFHIPNKVRQRHGRFEPNKGVNMIGDAIDNDGLLPLVFDDARHIFENFVSPWFLKQVLATLHGKDNFSKSQNY
jgi:hypothetical protein